MIPNVTEPFGGERNWKHATVNETEVATASLRDGSTRSDFMKLRQYGERIAGVFGKRFFEGLHCSQRVLCWKHRSLFQLIDVLAGKLTRSVEQQGKVLGISWFDHSSVPICLGYF